MAILASVAATMTAVLCFRRVIGVDGGEYRPWALARYLIGHSFEEPREPTVAGNALVVLMGIYNIYCSRYSSIL